MTWSNRFTNFFNKRKKNLHKKKRLWIIFVIILPFLIGFTLYSLTQVKEVAAQWWDETWLYRKMIQISNSNAENLENFQISFTLDTASLISANKIQTNCADLRITDLDGNLLPHWIEESNPGCNAVNTKIWVKIPNIYRGNNATNIFIYYGNIQANNIENGDNVFELFDDFKEYFDWIGETTNFSLSTDGSRQVLVVSGGNTPGEIFKAASLENQYIVEMAIRVTSLANNDPHPGLIFASNGTVSDYYGFYIRASSNQMVETHNSSYGAFINSQTVDTNWHTYKAIVNSGFLEALYFDSIRQTSFDNWDITNSYSHIGIWSHGSGTAYYDNLFVRKYAPLEPSATPSSVEEISPVPIAYWKFDEGSGTTINDSSGQENHGTLYTVTRESAESCIDNQCLNFPGSGSANVNITHSQTLNFGTKDFTISAWALHRDYTYPKSNFMIKKSSTCYADGVQNAGFDLGHGYKANGIDVCIHDLLNNRLRSALIFDIGSQPSELINQWVHYTFVFDRTNDKLVVYINSKKQSNELDISTITDSINNTQPLIIGTMYGWQTDGLMDEIKIYPYVRSAEQIRSDYIAGNSKIGSKAVFGHQAETALITPSSVMSSVMGQSPESPAGPAGSRASDFCIPGDSSPCLAPIAEWNFAENQGTVINDVSGNNYIGNAININDSSWTKGNSNLSTAMSFNGTNQYVDFGNILNMGLNDMTITGWIKKDSNPLTNQYFVSKSIAAAQNYRYSVGIGTNGGIRIFMQGNGGADVSFNGNTVVTDNNWHHFSVIYDRDAEAKIYVDGVFDSSLTISQWQSANMVSNNPFRIGAYTNSDNITPMAFYQGELSQLRVYNYARTFAQIAWDYNRGAPVAHWRLDDCQGTTAHDYSSNSNHGTINIASGGSQNALGTCHSGDSAAAWYNGREGKFNNSLSFDGTDDYIDLGNNNSIRNFTNQISVSAWAKYNAYGGGGQSYSVIAVKGSPWTFLLENYASKIRFRVTVGGLDKSATDSVIHELNRWYHFVGTYDGATIKIYKDGNLVGSTSVTGNLAVNDVSAKIGTWQGTNYNFNGQIDEVRIYNYALTQEQIKLLYNENSAVRF